MVHQLRRGGHSPCRRRPLRTMRDYVACMRGGCGCVVSGVGVGASVGVGAGVCVSGVGCVGVVRMWAWCGLPR
eukprot:5383940-Prorocentrum_lima.AAC.1